MVFFLPLVYALLQRKIETTYETMFCVLEETGCDPSIVIVDFERGIEHTLHSVFGVQYCFTT